MSAVESNVMTGAGCRVIFVLQLFRVLPHKRQFRAIFNNLWRWVYIDSLLPFSGRTYPSLWDCWRAGHLSALLHDTEARGRSFLSELLQATLQAAVSRLHLNDSDSISVESMVDRIRIVRGLLIHEKLGKAVESRILRILKQREANSVSNTRWIELLFAKASPSLSTAGTLSRAVMVEIEKQVCGALSTFLENVACDGGFAMMSSLTDSSEQAMKREKQDIWTSIVDVDATTEKPLWEMTSAAVLGRGGEFRSEFPLVRIIYNALDAMVRRVLTRAEGTDSVLLSTHSLICSSHSLSAVLRLAGSQGMIEAYIHDFVRFAYVPTQRTEVDSEYRIVERLLLGESQHLSVERNEDVCVLNGGHFASIHVIWSCPRMCACISRLRVVFSQVPSLLPALDAEFLDVRCRSALLERSVLTHVMLRLIPEWSSVGMRQDLARWIKSIWALKRIMPDLVANAQSKPGDDFEANFRKLEIAALFAECSDLGDGQELIEFWNESMKGERLIGAPGLKFILEYLFRSDKAALASSWAGEFFGKLVEGVYRGDFVVAGYLDVSCGVDIDLLPDAFPMAAHSAHPTRLSLDSRAKVTVIRTLIDVLRSDESDQMKSAACARLLKLFAQRDGAKAVACTKRILLSASEDFLSLRFGSTDPEMLEPEVLRWARLHLGKGDSGHEYWFGVACAQRALTWLVSLLFSDSEDNAERKRSGAHLDRVAAQVSELCAQSSPFQDGCRSFFLDQTARRFGGRAVRALALRPGNSWMEQYVPFSLLADRTDFFEIHGAAYMRLCGEPAANSASDPALVVLASFNDVSSLALDAAKAGAAVAQRRGGGAGNWTRCRQVWAGAAGMGDGVAGVLEAMMCGLSTNSLGGSQAGLHRAVLTVSLGQPEAGVLLLQLLQHAATAAAFGGALAQPLRELLAAPGFMAGKFVPAAPSFEEQRAVMLGTGGVAQ